MSGLATALAVMSGAPNVLAVPPERPAAPPADEQTHETAETSAEASELKTAEPAQEEHPEPQNALTQKFTDAEWKALKEFRVCVVSARDAYWWPSLIHLTHNYSRYFRTCLRMPTTTKRARPRHPSRCGVSPSTRRTRSRVRRSLSCS
jgi:hypothetical protein